LEKSAYKDAQLIDSGLLFGPDPPVVQDLFLICHTQDNIRITDINAEQHRFHPLD